MGRSRSTIPKPLRGKILLIFLFPIMSIEEVQSFLHEILVVPEHAGRAKFLQKGGASMSAIKLNKLFATLEKERGAQKSFVITAKNVNITMTGEIHKFDDHYCFTKGAGRVLIEQEKSGSMLTWRGTYKKYMVKFMVGEAVLAEFELPENAKIQLADVG